ncbi:MAG: hypothetical protein QME81_16395 [bacterium]|nr:hypothetical protein [bacterium]
MESSILRIGTVRPLGKTAGYIQRLSGEEGSRFLPPAIQEERQTSYWAASPRSSIFRRVSINPHPF